MNTAKAFYDVLTQDAFLVDKLVKYNGRPGVFTTDVAPPTAADRALKSATGARPQVLGFVITSDPDADVPLGSKVETVRDITRDIRCYAPSRSEKGLPMSVNPITVIAERVRELFDQNPPLPFHGWQCRWVTVLSGPTKIDEDDMYGRLISVRLIVEEVI